ncbi:DUF4249 domain-containing protein [Mucilaginibacter sp.]|jgi:hypothetical protein|uniref:DUF4249 domain-containing protein n=1 Tax=Mucilaginibacter sp. TaxID=1882438 RepID=UPI002C61F419|nr:DUF4249 domain-containing protein [Mucilaginibacter sp.]HTI58409.1 DUF4249 domain-containing protein [Mucilaginibacter sp.]
MSKWLIVLFVALLTVGCKKAFEPKDALASANRYLVVEGTINTGADSTFITLSRTKKYGPGVQIDRETNAQLIVQSDAGNTYSLYEVRPGVYSAAPLNLDNTHKYRLHIKTAGGKEYLSDYVEVKDSPSIDSVGFAAQTNGVQVYVNTHDDANATKYYRWEYSETWQFQSFFESYMLGDEPRHVCYATDTSTAVLLANSNKLSGDLIYQAPLAFIQGTSEKIETKYTILVKQYALTTDAYNFWLGLQKNTDRLGSIFDAQPTVNQSNYHCVTDPQEFVVGYLSAGRVATKRIFILASQLPGSYKVKYPVGCILDSAFYYHEPFYTDPKVLGPEAGTTPVEPFYIAPLGPFGAPNFITYSTTTCVDCTIRGKTNPPPYWR